MNKFVSIYWAKFQYESTTRGEKKIIEHLALSKATRKIKKDRTNELMNEVPIPVFSPFPPFPPFPLPIGIQIP